MMPFIVGRNFKECQLPEYLEPYWSLLNTCLIPQINRERGHFWPKDMIPSDLGKIYYLTVQENWVEAEVSQRRPGLHVDSPGSVKIKGEDHDYQNQSDLDQEGNGKSQLYRGHRWGNGCAHSIGQQNVDEYDMGIPNVYAMQGGIYLASSVSDSCRAWNCSVDSDVIGTLGDVEHLRGFLPGEGKVLELGQLYWITDKTPHESLPLKERTYRQFFRLVTADVSLWYKDHSTANPLGVEPDPAVTKIVAGDKFADEGVEIIEHSPEAIEKREKFMKEFMEAGDKKPSHVKTKPKSSKCTVG